MISFFTATTRSQQLLIINVSVFGWVREQNRGSEGIEGRKGGRLQNSTTIRMPSISQFGLNFGLRGEYRDSLLTTKSADSPSICLGTIF